MLLRKLRLDWRYGLGELGIVVAGVLIALYADGLWQRSQERALELTYLTRLSEDLRADTAAIRSIMELTATRAEHGRDVLATYDSGVRRLEPRAFVEAVEYAGFFSYPSYSRAAIDDLMSTGNLRLLQEPSVKEVVARYYAEIDWTQQFRDLYRRTQGELNDFMPELLTLDQRYALVQESIRASCGPTLACAGTIPWAPDGLDVSADEADALMRRLLDRPAARPLYANMARIQGVHYANLASIRQLAIEALSTVDRYISTRQ